MDLFNVFAAMTLTAVAVNIIIFIQLISYLNKRDVKINLFKLRLMLPYVNRFKQMTTKEAGSPGSLYKYWLITINATLFFAVLMIVTAAV